MSEKNLGLKSSIRRTNGIARVMRIASKDRLLSEDNVKQCSDPGCQKLVPENGINTVTAGEKFFCDFFCRDEWQKGQRDLQLPLPLGLQKVNGGSDT